MPEYSPLYVLLGALVCVLLLWVWWQTITIPWKIDKANKLLEEILCELKRKPGSKPESSARYVMPKD